MTRPIWIACGEKPAIYDRRQSPIVVQKHQQRQRKPAMALCINLWLLKTPFFARRPKHHPHPAADPPKTGHRRARHQFTFRHTPQDARSPRRTKCAARTSCMSEDALGGNLLSARTCSPRAVRQVTPRCKPSCAYPQQHQTGCPSGSRGASSSQDRSRCSQPGRSQSRRHRRPCCRSRRPGR